MLTKPPRSMKVRVPSKYPAIIVNRPEKVPDPIARESELLQHPLSTYIPAVPVQALDLARRMRRHIRVNWVWPEVLTSIIVAYRGGKVVAREP